MLIVQISQRYLIFDSFGFCISITLALGQSSIGRSARFLCIPGAMRLRVRCINFKLRCQCQLFLFLSSPHHTRPIAYRLTKFTKLFIELNGKCYVTVFAFRPLFQFLGTLYQTCDIFNWYVAIRFKSLICEIFVDFVTSCEVQFRFMQTIFNWFFECGHFAYLNHRWMKAIGRLSKCF